MFSRRTAILVTLVLLVVVPGLGVSPPALGFGGEIHAVATQRACDVMEVWNHMWAITGDDSFAPYRTAAGAHMFPELSNDGCLLAGALVESVGTYDAYVGDWGTRNHFWTVAEGLHECPERIAGVDNAWETALANWATAIYLYEQGDHAGAMFYLGAVAHLVEDMGQPAHTNSDLHGPANRDSLEEWGDTPIIAPMYSWTGHPGAVSPGKFFKPPSKAAIIQRVSARTGWVGHDEFVDDPHLSDPNDPMNCAQLFWIMYVTNEWANYFASDGESGNTTVPLGWVDYDALGFPKYLHRNRAHVLAQREMALDDNEGDCGHPGATHQYCNRDGDLTTIAKWCYAAAMRGAGGVIELFRRTVDSTPPVTRVTLTRRDTQPYVAGSWSNTPVTVLLSDAVDPTEGGCYFQHATGIWTVYGLINGGAWNPMPPFPIMQLWTTFASSGTHTVQVRTTDNAGNIEHKGVVVKVDVTLPIIHLLYWQDRYLTCQQPKATWSASDTQSGLKFVQGTLDGQPLVVNTLIDRARLYPGQHTLVVSAQDQAGNLSIAAHQFSVLLESGLAVGKPDAPLRAGATKTYAITGSLEPQHYIGSAAVNVVIQKKQDGDWVFWRRLVGKAGPEETYRCWARMVAGTFRVRAEHHFPRLCSAWTRFKVE